MITWVQFNSLGISLDCLLILFSSKSSITLLFPILSRLLDVHSLMQIFIQKKKYEIIKIEGSSRIFYFDPKNIIYKNQTIVMIKLRVNCIKIKTKTIKIDQKYTMKNKQQRLFKSINTIINFRLIKILLLMSKQFLTFKKEFLKQQNYQDTKRNSLGLNKKYEDLCQILQREFKILIDDKTGLAAELNLNQFLQKQKSFRFITELKAFINDFMTIQRQMSEFQIECLRNLRDNNLPQFEIIFKVVQKIKENKFLCEQIERKTNTLYQSYSLMKRSFPNIQKDFKNPIVFYEQEVVLTKCQELKAKITQNWKLMNQILQKKQSAQQKIEQFQPYLSTFRKKLIKNKYSVLKKIVYLIKNTKNAIIEMVQALRFCSQHRKQQFQKTTFIQNNETNHLKKFWNTVNTAQYIEHYTQENKTWERLILLSANQLQKSIEQLQNIYSKLISYFTNLKNKFTQQNEILWNILQQISQIYQQHESPNALMKQLFGVQQFFILKVNNIVKKLENINYQLKFQKTNNRKQAQMLLTLVKVNKNNKKSFVQYYRQNQNSVSELIDQFSFSTIKKIMIAYYDQCIDLQNQVLQNFDSVSRRKTQDSMDISHTQSIDSVSFDKYIPLRQEIWLYKQWRGQIQVNFQSYNQLFKEIEQYLDSVINIVNIKQSSVLQKTKCILKISNNNIEGELVIKVNSLHFYSKEVNLCIGWKQISSINTKLTVFKDVIVIQTARGKLKFYKFQNIQNIVQTIKQTQERSMMSNQKPIIKKKTIQLGEEQLKFISERKQKFTTEIPNLQSYKFVIDQTFQQKKIDQIYDLVYSDKPFSFYGKQQPCFFSYVGKKAGNYNWVAEKYDKIGPSFYTLNQQVTFKNCPVSSTRIISFNHPMKPSPIPFMPKFCLNRDERKIYWISHEQLLYTIQSITTGVPYADHFIVYVAHKIKQGGNGVKIEVYSNVKWVKETMMKSKIQSTIYPQVEENMKVFLNQIRKALKLMGQIQRGEATIPQKQLTQQKKQEIIQPSQQNQIFQLKFQNKVLIGVLLALVIINLVNMIFND